MLVFRCVRSLMLECARTLWLFLKGLITNGVLHWNFCEDFVFLQLLAATSSLLAIFIQLASFSWVTWGVVALWVSLSEVMWLKVEMLLLFPPTAAVHWRQWLLSPSQIWNQNWAQLPSPSFGLRSPEFRLNFPPPFWASFPSREKVC